MRRKRGEVTIDRGTVCVTPSKGATTDWIEIGTLDEDTQAKLLKWLSKRSGVPWGKIRNVRVVADFQE